jgi:hypothetical protein
VNIIYLILTKSALFSSTKVGVESLKDPEFINGKTGCRLTGTIHLCNLRNKDVSELQEYVLDVLELQGYVLDVSELQGYVLDRHLG